MYICHNVVIVLKIEPTSYIGTFISTSYIASYVHVIITSTSDLQPSTAISNNHLASQFYKFKPYKWLITLQSLAYYSEPTEPLTA